MNIHRSKENFHRVMLYILTQVPGRFILRSRIFFELSDPALLEYNGERFCINKTECVFIFLLYNNYLFLVFSRPGFAYIILLYLYEGGR